jgi:hypothetical protein
MSEFPPARNTGKLQGIIERMPDSVAVRRDAYLAAVAIGTRNSRKGRG